MAALVDAKSLPLHLFRPTDHLRSFLRNSVRIDGRGLSQSRPWQVTADALHAQHVVGSSQVQLGGTSVMCAVSVLIGTPSVTHPDNGDVDCVVNMNHLLVGHPALSTHKDNAKLPAVCQIEQSVVSLFNRGVVFDLSQLSIVKGKFAFRLVFNITVLSNAGNVLDVCLLSAVRALRSSSLPGTIPDVTTANGILVDANLPRIPLKCALAIPVTIGILDEYLFIDPTTTEEANMTGSVTVVVDADSLAMLSVSISSTGLSRQLLHQAIEMSQQHCLACAAVFKN